VERTIHAFAVSERADRNGTGLTLFGTDSGASTWARLVRDPEAAANMAKVVSFRRDEH